MTPRIWFFLAAPFISWAWAAAPARADAPARLSAAERADALKAIAAALEKSYVDTDLRPALAARLTQGQRAGRYDTDNPFLFAERITEDLRDVSHDGHMWMTVDLPGYTAASAAPGSDAGEEAYFRRKAVREHHGLVELRRLPGNIRYLKIAEFAWVTDETGAVYDDAVRFLRDGDAIIIDLRGNPGGTHAAVQYLVSHFLDADKLEITFNEAGEPPKEARSLEYLPAGRLKGKPLYVLIDGRVGSAAEAFAYDVQQFKLGELVGAKTAGAANNNKLVPIAPTFVLSVSYGRPIHAVSHSNWDGVGVSPTVEAASVQALEVAQSLALARLAKVPGATPEALAELAWARVPVEARLHPVTVTPARLPTLAGHFGDIDVIVRGGVLWMERPRRPPAPLAPLTADGIFAIEGIDVLRVRLTGKTLELLWYDEPAPRVYPRR